MKKLSLLLLFFATITEAQIVNIPDLNFKTRLITANSSNSTAGNMSADGTYFTVGTVIDTNGNGEIEFSEATEIDYLNVSTYFGSPSSISSIQGIEAFVNLKLLNCSYNIINTLEVSNLTNLQYFICNDNLLTSLNLSGLNYLKSIRCSGNLLTDVDFSVLPLLESAGCASNQFVSLDFSNNLFFYDLGAANNLQLTSINLQNGVTQNTAWGIQACDGFSNCPNLNFICADSNEISLVQQMISFSLPGQTVNVENCLLGSDAFAFNDNLKIYPNPTSGFVSINSNEKIKSIELIDAQGRIINAILVNDTKLDLDISTYSNGIYFLKITTDKGSKVEKIIKE